MIMKQINFIDKKKGKIIIRNKSIFDHGNNNFFIDFCRGSVSVRRCSFVCEMRAGDDRVR